MDLACLESGDCAIYRRRQGIHLGQVVQKAAPDVAFAKIDSSFVAYFTVGRPVGSIRTFHLSMSSCFARYCLTKSSRTFFRPSAFVCSAGSTSLTVRSTSTPLIMRKHFRSPGKGVKVSSTSLTEVLAGETLLFLTGIN
ncbi:hypothetical protein KC349_g98 [Hortaea werneckii]|nr:hypothetical protein KC349_g98 [Hortaea werneckii]